MSLEDYTFHDGSELDSNVAAGTEPTMDAKS